MDDTQKLSRLHFKNKPWPTFPEKRLLYRICQTLLVLALASRGGRSSLQRLQLFNWAFKKNERIAQLKHAADTKKLKILAWGFDPSLAIALNFAAAEGLIIKSSSGYQITNRGEEVTTQLINDEQLLLDIKTALRLIKKSITESMIDETISGWKE